MDIKELAVAMLFAPEKLTVERALNQPWRMHICYNGKPVCNRMIRVLGMDWPYHEDLWARTKQPCNSCRRKEEKAVWEANGLRYVRKEVKP